MCFCKSFTYLPWGSGRRRKRSRVTFRVVARRFKCHRFLLRRFFSPERGVTRRRELRLRQGSSEVVLRECSGVGRGRKGRREGNDDAEENFLSLTIF